MLCGFGEAFAMAGTWWMLENTFEWWWNYFVEGKTWFVSRFQRYGIAMSVTTWLVRSHQMSICMLQEVLSHHTNDALCCGHEVVWSIAEEIQWIHRQGCRNENTRALWITSSQRCFIQGGIFLYSLTIYKNMPLASAWRGAGNGDTHLALCKHWLIQPEECSWGISVPMPRKETQDEKDQLSLQGGDLLE